MAWWGLVHTHPELSAQLWSGDPDLTPQRLTWARILRAGPSFSHGAQQVLLRQQWQGLPVDPLLPEDLEGGEKEGGSGPGCCSILQPSRAKRSCLCSSRKFFKNSDLLGLSQFQAENTWQKKKGGVHSPVPAAHCF